jgi:cation-transporting ATPase 13A1
MDIEETKNIASTTEDEDINISSTPLQPSSSLQVADKHISTASLHSKKFKYFRFDILPFLTLYILILAVALPAIYYEISHFEFASDELDSLNSNNLLNQTRLNNTSIDHDDLAVNIETEDDLLKNSTAAAIDLDRPDSIHFYFMFSLPIVGLIHAVVMLMAYWNIKLATKLRYNAVNHSSIDSLIQRLNAGKTEPIHVQVIPIAHSGAAAVVPLQPYTNNIDNITTVYFVFQKVKYIYNTALHQFIPLQFPVSQPIKEYLTTTGLNNNQVQLIRNKFGLNQFDIPLPPFMELFEEHAMSPFFVFQVFCVLLWCLDEYWYYSIMTLFMLVAFECTVVQRRLKHLQYLRDMRVAPYDVQVYRSNKWEKIKTNELLPGDIISMTRTIGDSVVPADLLLLYGSAVVNEALLTGESVPQVKESADNLDFRDILQLNKDNKRNIIFGGTKLLITSDQRNSTGLNSAELAQIKSPPDHGCICYVLRTGFSTSQGKLVRTILFSTERVSVNNKESLLFIGFLLIFAVAASGYVLNKGLEDPDRSRYKLMLNCIMIITSVVPPELPMELSLAVNTSLMELAKQQIFCTEPFRIPLAGAIDTCCFDKTGTLTSDNFIVRGIAGALNSASNNSNSIPNSAISDAAGVDFAVKVVLAGCHSLTWVSDAGLIGDPLEKAAFRAIQWKFGAGEVATSENDSKQRLRIVQRFPFNSTLKRMSCIVNLEAEPTQFLRVVAKGAAEIMQNMFVSSSKPANYSEIHSFYSKQGCRVLALGWKQLEIRDNPDDRKKLRALSREEVENQLIFAGFLILECPLKPDSIETIGNLINSNHDCVLITGDALLTAASVAAQCKITNKPIAIATFSKENSVIWEDIDGKLLQQFDSGLNRGALSEFSAKFDLCITGDVMEYLTAKLKFNLAQMGALIEQIKVFARTSPDQKELILTALKALGRMTLMCGDGTNDVGALKQAHIGVALIGDDGTKEKEEGEEKKEKKVAVKPVQPSFRELAAMNNTDRQAAITKFREELKAAADEAPQIKLGDASIASPFTSKQPYITATTNIIRQGRCTLVTTLQMFNILGINCLISAYSMSVLYLDGVKMGDTQMTIAGLSIAMFFLFLSRAKPLEKLSAERPESRLFTPHMFLSLIGQFIIHLSILLYAIDQSNPYTPETAEHRSPDTAFKPNVLNTVVYLVSTSCTVVNFAANYRGRPFMQSLQENSGLYKAIVATMGLMLLLASEMIPELNEALQLHPLPSAEFRMELMGLIILDLVIVLGYTRFLKRVFRYKAQKAGVQRTAVAAPATSTTTT